MTGKDNVGIGGSVTVSSMHPLGVESERLRKLWDHDRESRTWKGG
jgi:hypothetical protein